MFLDSSQKFLDAFILVGNDLGDWRSPIGHEAVQIQHHIDLADQFVCTIDIRFIDAVQIPDLQYTGLDCLDIIAHTRDQYNNRCICCLDDIYLRLTNADGLNDDDVLSKGVHCFDSISSLMGKTTQAAACAHTADKDSLVEGQTVHADTVAKDGTARKRTGWIDSYDAHCLALFPVFSGNLVGQCALASTWRTSDAEYISMSGMRIDLPHDLGCFIVFILNRCNSPGKR